MARAVAVPPVRITASIFAWLTNSGASREPEHGANCNARRDTPARQKHWHSSHATSTASDDGLSTTVLPAASAADTPPQGIAIGKFHGATTTTTPTGRARSVGICRHQRAAAR